MTKLIAGYATVLNRIARELARLQNEIPKPAR
jgi:hypothetical protein